MLNVGLLAGREKSSFTLVPRVSYVCYEYLVSSVHHTMEIKFLVVQWGGQTGEYIK